MQLEMEEFFEKTQQYVKHVHVARWQDEQFRVCRDTFPIGTILSVVDFVENYTLQPQNTLSLISGQHNGTYHLYTCGR